MSTKINELAPMHDRAKSFYGKAYIITDGYGTQTLYSYSTPVLSIDAHRNVSRHWHGYSVTTMRHVDEFMRQRGFDPCGKSWWDAQPVREYNGVRFYF